VSSLKDTRSSPARRASLCSCSQSTFSDDDRSCGLESGLKALVRGSLDGLDLRELDRDLRESSCVFSENLVGLDNARLDDLNRLVRSSVSSAHLHVYNRIRQG
jgi:hypothetical protein